MKISRDKLRILLIYVALVLATIIAFEPVRKNHFVDFDDDDYVTENPQVRAGITRESTFWAFTTPHVYNWHPLTWLSHMLDCELFGLNPVGHHLTNLFFHMANSLLLFWILKRMTGSVWPSAFVATVFALHPLRVESVAWIAERKDVLSGLFWMLTMAAYIQYAKRPAIGRYLLVVLAFGLGLMAKQMLVTLPFVLLLLDYWPMGRFTVKGLSWRNSEQKVVVASARRCILEKLPLLILTVIASIIIYLVQQSHGIVRTWEYIPLKIRIFNTLISYIRYIGKMLYPRHLSVLYPHPGISLPTWKPIVCFIILTAISVGIIYKSRRYRYLAVGWLWYLGTLIPVIGLVQVGDQAMADRYTYIPLIGINIMVAWGVSELIAKWHYRKILVTISAAVVFGALLICTREQVGYWQDSLTLYGHAVEVTENNFIMHNHYGRCLRQKGQYEEALRHCNEALRINPRYYKALKTMGKVFLEQGKLDEAIACFNQVLTVSGKWFDLHYSLGVAYAQQDKTDQAAKHFAEALRLKPDYTNARIHLAHSLVGLGKIELAFEHYYKILEVTPDRVEVLNALAWVWATVENTKFQNPTKAVKFAERACELTGHQKPGAMDTLAAAYAAAGRFNQAIETAEKAIKLAVSAGEKELAEEIQTRLHLYRAGQPYREK